MKMWQLALFKLGIFLIGGLILSRLLWGLLVTDWVTELRPAITQAETFHELNPALQRLAFSMEAFGAGNTRTGAQELSEVQRLAERSTLVVKAGFPPIEAKHELIETQLAIAGMNLDSFSPWSKTTSLVVFGLALLFLLVGIIPLMRLI